MSSDNRDMSQPGSDRSEASVSKSHGIGQDRNLSTFQSSPTGPGTLTSRIEFHFAKKPIEEMSGIEENKRDQKFDRYKGLMSRSCGKRKSLDSGTLNLHVCPTDPQSRPVDPRDVPPSESFRMHSSPKRLKMHSEDSPNAATNPGVTRASLETQEVTPKPVVIDLCNDDSDDEPEQKPASPEVMETTLPRDSMTVEVAKQEEEKVTQNSKWWKNLKSIPAQILSHKSSKDSQPPSSALVVNIEKSNSTLFPGALSSQWSLIPPNRKLNECAGMMPAPRTQGEVDVGQHGKISQPCPSNVHGQLSHLQEEVGVDTIVDARPGESKTTAALVGPGKSDTVDPTQISGITTVPPTSQGVHPQTASPILLHQTLTSSAEVVSKDVKHFAKVHEEFDVGGFVVQEIISRPNHRTIKQVKIFAESEDCTRESSFQMAGDSSLAQDNECDPSLGVKPFESKFGTGDGDVMEGSDGFDENQMSSETIEENRSDASATLPMPMNNGNDDTMRQLDENPEDTTPQGSELIVAHGALSLLHHSRAIHDGHGTGNKQITFGMIGISFLILIVLSLSLRWLHSPSLSNVIVLESLGGTFQLALVGLFSSLLLKHGGCRRVGLITYLFIIVVLGSHEVATRTKYSYDDQFYHIFASIAFNVFWVGSTAIGLITKEEQAWSPQYVLPITCMLLGSCINGVTLSLDALSSSLVEEKAEIQLLQAFGGSRYEVSHRLLTASLQKGLAGVLTMMHTMGTSGIIPMLMCGQMLGGASVKQATLLQIMTTVFMTICTLCSVVMSSMVTLYSAFGPGQILKTDHFVRNPKWSLFGRLWVICSSFGRLNHGPISFTMSDSWGSTESSTSPIAMQKLSIIPAHPSANDSPVILSASKLFSDRLICESAFGMENCEAVLPDGVSLSLHVGEVAEVGGAPDIVISELFYTLAALRPVYNDELCLAGEYLDEVGASNWRKDVLVVPTGKPGLHGTPLQFLRRVSSFRSHKIDHLADKKLFSKMIDEVSDYLFQWGLTLDCLSKDWNDLSDEEGYLILLSSALASQPKVLLLHDMEMISLASKISVKNSIETFANKRGSAVLCMSDDAVRED